MQTLPRSILLTAAPALYLFILPFAHTTALRTVAFVLTLATAIVVWREQRRSGPPARIPLIGSLALWAIVALATLPWAADVRFSLSEIKAEIGYGILVYLAFYVLTRRASDLHRSIVAIAAAVLVLCIHALWTFAGTRSIEGDNLHGGVLYFITFLVTVIPVLLAGAVAPDASPRARIGATLLVLLALGTGALGLNRSYVPIVGLSVALFVLLYFCGVGAPRRAKLRAGFAAVLIVPILASGFLWITQHRAGPEMSLAGAVERAVTTDPRIKIWDYSLARIAEHPWTGTGFGRMARADKFRKEIGDESAVHPHNLFLSHAVQSGIPGMLAVLLLFVTIVRRMVGLYRDADPTIRLIGIAGLSVVFAVLLKSMVDDLFVRHNAWLFWALLGMGFGYAARRRASAY